MIQTGPSFVMSENNIINLIESARRGDEKAFREIARTVQDSGKRYAASILRDDDLAEEAVQEALLESFQQLDRLQIPEAYPSWFRKIVFKQCDRIRRKKEFDQQGYTEDLPGRSMDDPAELFLRNEIFQRVLDAMKTLPTRDQKLAELRYIHETGYTEIAHTLNISEDTVKNRLRTIRVRLRHNLRDLNMGTVLNQAIMSLVA